MHAWIFDFHGLNTHPPFLPSLWDKYLSCISVNYWFSPSPWGHPSIKYACLSSDCLNQSHINYTDFSRLYYAVKSHHILAQLTLRFTITIWTLNTVEINLTSSWQSHFLPLSHLLQINHWRHFLVGFVINLNIFTATGCFPKSENAVYFVAPYIYINNIKKIMKKKNNSFFPTGSFRQVLIVWHDMILLKYNLSPSSPPPILIVSRS